MSQRAGGLSGAHHLSSPHHSVSERLHRPLKATLGLEWAKIRVTTTCVQCMRSRNDAWLTRREQRIAPAMTCVQSAHVRDRTCPTVRRRAAEALKR